MGSRLLASGTDRDDVMSISQALFRAHLITLCAYPEPAKQILGTEGGT